MMAAVIVAAGRGQRLGAGVPKALRLLHGQPMYTYSLNAALACAEIHSVVLVVPSEHVDQLAQNNASAGSRVRVVAGGSTRQRSVIAGVTAAAPEVNWVAVHDAARPLITPVLFRAVSVLAREIGSAVSAHPATDTIRRVAHDGTCVTLPRAELWHAETPQVFRRVELLEALRKCEQAGVEVTDEAEAMERMGQSPALFHNAEANPKISTETDWQLVETLLRTRSIVPH